MPPYNRCLYVKTFLNIVKKYDLELTLSEKNKINIIEKKECN
jgi:hypothetical protein